jgi:hypothetical protein
MLDVLKELGQFKGHEVCIILEDNIPIFVQLRRLSETKRTLVHVWTMKLVDVGFMELLKGKYVLVITMPTTKEFFHNSIEQHVWG